MIMTRELLLFRHGKSDWSTGVDDYHRPLKDRGKRGAQRMATWIWRRLKRRPISRKDRTTVRWADTFQRLARAMISTDPDGTLNPT